MKRSLTPILILAVTALVACTADTAPDDAASHGEDEAPTTSNRVAIPETVRRNLGITFVKVDRRDVRSTVRVPGAFELDPLARHEYRMALPGRIELLVQQYDNVAPGTPLYRYRSPAWPELQHEIIGGAQSIASARAEVELARTALEEAKSRLRTTGARIETLAEADFRQADLEALAADLAAALPKLEAGLIVAKTKLANAEGSYAHALRRGTTVIGLSESELLAEVDRDGRTVPRYLAIEWLEVLATEAGIVEQVAAANGSYVEPPGLVLSIVDPTRVRFRAIGLQSDLAKYASAGAARIVPPRAEGFAPSDYVEAKVALGLEADPAARTITLIATMNETRTWTRPGVSAFLEVHPAGGRDVALAIPKSSVVEDGLRHVFFRRDPNDPDQAIRVEADLGDDDGRWVEVNSGVALGDEIVLDGVYELKLATAQDGRQQQGGHFHADGTFHEGH